MGSMCDAKSTSRRKLINLFGSEAMDVAAFGRGFVRLRTHLCGGEQAAQSESGNEMRASRRKYSPGTLHGWRM